MKRSFEVLAGTHSHTDGKDYTAGQIVRDTHLDLATMFVGKFKEVTVAPSAVPVASPSASAGEGGKAPAAYVPVESALGADVTPNFQSAMDADYKVFQKGKKFFVAESPDFNKALNKTGLVEADVADYVKDLVA